MTVADPGVLLRDVDNTLLDNDRVQGDLLDQDNLSTYFPADRIGALLGCNCSALPGPSALVVLEKESK